MNTAAIGSSNSDPLRPRAPAGMGRGAALALLFHVLLVLALALALHWRSEAPQTYAAELWAATPQVAAPRAQATPPTPPEPAPPQPKPAPAPPPKPAPPPQPTQAERDAQIAIEQAKKAAADEAERERAARDKAQREKAAQLERERVERAQRERAEQAEQDRVQREKAEQAKAKAKEEARQKELQAQRDKQAEDARLAKLREDNLKRMMGQAGATGAPGSTGTALRDAAPSASYAGKLIARVRPNILLTEPLPDSLKADVEVRAAPSGAILSRRLVKSSGNKTWDDAVLRAIDRTGELPRDVDGRVPPVLVITFTP